jgi:hypothetical protein
MEDMMSKKNVRCSEIDRRSKSASTDVKCAYADSERRSGKERRKWIDRMREIHLKIKGSSPI